VSAPGRTWATMLLRKMANSVIFDVRTRSEYNITAFWYAISFNLIDRPSISEELPFSVFRAERQKRRSTK
jgi:hypothetical protein